MKLSVNIALAALAVFTFLSCEKIIDPQLNSAAKKYVIEANIDNAGGCTVIITQSKSVNDNNNFEGISSAMVTMRDNGAAPVVLAETGKGIYQANGISGAPGHTYVLSVAIGTQTFTSSSTMPSQVNLDSVFVEDRVFFGDSMKLVNVSYQDPAASGNAYHFIQYKNGVRESTVFVTNDDFTNGNKVTSGLFVFGDDDEKIKSGDTIRVVMECIDTANYTYWTSLDAATGSSNNATPANPLSNISGGALGYFSAHTTQTKTVIVK